MSRCKRTPFAIYMVNPVLIHACLWGPAPPKISQRRSRQEDPWQLRPAPPRIEICGFEWLAAGRQLLAPSVFNCTVQTVPSVGALSRLVQKTIHCALLHYLAAYCNERATLVIPLGIMLKENEKLIQSIAKHPLLLSLSLSHSHAHTRTHRHNPPSNHQPTGVVDSLVRCCSRSSPHSALSPTAFALGPHWGARSPVGVEGAPRTPGLVA